MTTQDYIEKLVFAYNLLAGEGLLSDKERQAIQKKVGKKAADNKIKYQSNKIYIEVLSKR